MYFSIKKHDLKSIKYKLEILFLLNVTDILLTIILIKTGLFEEVNILMKLVVNNTFLSLLIKIGLVSILLVGLFYRMKTATIKQLKIANKIILSAIFVYGLINLSHVAWSILAIITLGF